MNYPVFNTKDVRPWVKKFPCVARIVAVIDIPFMFIAVILASTLDAGVYVKNDLLPAFTEQVKYQLKLAFYKWEDNE